MLSIDQNQTDSAKRLQQQRLADAGWSGLVFKTGFHTCQFWFSEKLFPKLFSCPKWLWGATKKNCKIEDLVQKDSLDLGLRIYAGVKSPKKRFLNRRGGGVPGLGLSPKFYHFFLVGFPN